MTRTGRRFSRSLIGILVITLVLGVFLYFKNVKQSRADEPRPHHEAAVVAKPPKEAAPATQPQLITSMTPTTAAPTLGAPTTTPASGSTPGVAPAASQRGGAGAAFAAWNNTPQVAATGSVADALAKRDAGDLLGARRALNALLLSGKLSSADVDSTKKAISEINQTVIFEPQRFADDEFGGSYNVQPGDKLKKIAESFEVPWELLLKINGMSDARRLRAGQALKIVKGPFNVIVSKSKFTLELYLGPAGESGSMYVTSFPVGLGRDDSTPTGVWQAAAGNKIKDPTYYSPRGEGVIDANDPRNPLGHRWIGLTGVDGHAMGKRSYGIHGTIDENSIGKQESMGCIRLHNADIAQVFDMLVDGKSMVIVKD